MILQAVPVQLLLNPNSAPAKLIATLVIIQTIILCVKNVLLLVQIVITLVNVPNVNQTHGKN